jgi:hypothetical protein
VEKPLYSGLGHGEVDIRASSKMGSKTLEASNASNDQPNSLQD